MTSRGPDGIPAADSSPGLRGYQARVLVSLDIDGTLEFGQPPGPVLLHHVREVQHRGSVVGSSSDRTLEEQRRLWRTAGIHVDFVSHKHNLNAIRTQFACTRHVHIGDTDVDEYYAHLAGFEFWHVDRLPTASASDWIY